MRFISVLAALLISACAYQPKPQLPSALTYIQRNSNDKVLHIDISEKETRSLADLIDIQEITPWLTRLTQRSFDLKISELQRLQQALAIQQSESHRLPELSAVSSAERTKSHLQQTPYQTQYQLGAQVSWELDLWNKIALQSDSAALDYTKSLIQQSSLRRSIAAQAIKHLLTYSAFQSQINDEERVVSILGQLKDKSKKQWASGLTSSAAFEVANERYLEAAFSLEQNQQKHNEVRLQLRQLAQMEKHEELPALRSMVALPNATVTGKYLLQRPDIHQAFIDIKKVDINGKMAYRSLYPSFSLNLDIRQTAIGEQNLLGSDPLWQLLGQLTMPVFQGGRLRRDIDIAEYESRKALVAYKKNFQDAYFEVRRLMVRETSLTKMRLIQIARIESNQKLADTSLREYQVGMSDYSYLAGHQINLIQQQKALTLLKLEQSLNRIDLFLALGLPLYNSASPDKKQLGEF